MAATLRGGIRDSSTWQEVHDCGGGEDEAELGQEENSDDEVHGREGEQA